MSERNIFNTMMSVSEENPQLQRQMERDVRKIFKVMNYKPSEDWRVKLRTNYLQALETFVCIRQEHVLVKTKNELWIGKLGAIDPDHLNIILLDVEGIDSSIRASKILIRGDQVELILHFPSREQAERAVRRLITEKL
ncbi:MAG: hypothetical protein DRN15_07270 [Thermoprotei archaeon]|nr:MAG: hypothetical protein DRN15_07270 [Thermoprotei archaeon]